MALVAELVALALLVALLAKGLMVAYVAEGELVLADEVDVAALTTTNARLAVG